MQASAIEDLRSSARGDVVTPEDPGYDEARRVHNWMIDRRPAVIVRCADTTDVMATVRCARDNDMLLSVRGGGHSVPGFGTNDGGVVADLSPMRGVRVDPVTRMARAQGGCTWGDMNHATYGFGLAVTGGIISTTGIAGLTLGGGIGYLARGHGLSLDNLISVDVVTAEGDFIVANEAEHADLFWALRGGGGNFGVVTSFEYRLTACKDIFAGAFFYPLERAGDVLDFYRGFIRTAPEDLGLFAGFHLVPPLPFVPEEYHGDPAVVMVACWNGPMEQGERVLAPIRDSAPRLGEMMEPMPYPVLNSAFDELVGPGLQHYWKTAFATELTDGAIEAHLEYAQQVPTVNTAVHLYSINGACHRIAPQATAFANRDATFATVIGGMWPDPADNERNIAWVKDYYAALAPHSSAAAYVNFMSADDGARLPESYGDNYGRLQEVKRLYDPDNFFRMNQNIQPAPTAAATG